MQYTSVFDRINILIFENPDELILNGLIKVYRHANTVPNSRIKWFGSNIRDFLTLTRSKRFAISDISEKFIYNYVGGLQEGDILMRKTLFIYNPGAGDHSITRKLDYIIHRFLANGVLVQPYRFRSEDDEELPKLVREMGFESIIASGGDGTINFVVNMMMRNNLNIPMGIIPSGTCNDLAHSLGLPHTLKDCIDIILGGRTKSIDAGLINNRQYFLSTCAGGIFVNVSFNTNQELKRNFGPFAYYLKALTEVTNIKPFYLKVTTDEEVVEENVLLFLVINGKHGGGFSNLIKQADLSDGIMDIVLIKNCQHLDMVSLFFKVLSSASLEDKNVKLLRSRRCRLESDTKITLSVDGEKGPCLPVDIKFINRAVDVFVAQA